jgi:hypothetical protein
VIHLFAGASLPPLDGETAARFVRYPPARRGDLDRLRKTEKPATVLLIDGLFSQTLAVSPAECRQLVEAGWIVVGAASIGALRASDLWPIGMIGVGEVYELYRMGVLRSDDEVASALHPDDNRELTAPLVQVRAVLAQLRREGLLEDDGLSACLQAAREIHFLERSWTACLALWERNIVSAEAVTRASVLAKDPIHHPKIRDAQHAVRLVMAGVWL